MSERAVVDFDHMTPEFSRDPAGAFRALRERCPVAWTDAWDGFWVPTRWEDVQRVAEDDATYSSARHAPYMDVSAITIPRMPSFPNVPIETDPPLFFAYRRMLNPALSPATTDRVLAPIVRKLATYFVDRFIETGRVDLIDDLASPVPAVFTLAWLGLPLADWEFFAWVMHGIVALPFGSPEHDKAVAGLIQASEMYAEVVRERRREPTDDFISYLIAQEVGGEPLSDQTLLEMIGLLVAGGVDTTTSLTGHALMWLCQHPDQRERLIREPKLMDTATEEFLRYSCPVTHLARTVMHDTELNGQQLSAGERIMLPWAAANRDPEVFEAPDELRLDRRPNRHMAFGVGIHRCVGSNLARRSFKAILTEVLTRLPDYQIDESQAKPYDMAGVNSGWVRLPATFTPGPRSGQPAPYPELEPS